MVTCAHSKNHPFDWQAFPRKLTKFTKKLRFTKRLLKKNKNKKQRNYQKQKKIKKKSLNNKSGPNKRFIYLFYFLGGRGDGRWVKQSIQARYLLANVAKTLLEDWGALWCNVLIIARLLWEIKYVQLHMFGTCCCCYTFKSGHLLLYYLYLWPKAMQLLLFRQ